MWRDTLLRTSLVVTLAVAVSFPFAPGSVSGADEEALGQAVEQAGNFRQALVHFIAALQATEEGSPADQRLREKIISLAQKLRPFPAVPEEAERHMARGQAAVEMAKEPADFRRAEAEFEKALRVAPWLARGYFNLGVVQEKAGEFTKAIRSFKLYLLAAPGADDAQAVRSRIFGLEYKAERQREEERARAEKARREAQEKAEEARRQEAARIERERREAEERAAATLPTPGMWWNSCIGQGYFDPSNPVRIRVLSSQEFEYNTWSGIFKKFFEPGLIFKYESSSRSFVYRGAGRHAIKVISPDYVVWEYENGSKCELRRQR